MVHMRLICWNQSAFPPLNYKIQNFLALKLRIKFNLIHIIHYFIHIKILLIVKLHTFSHKMCNSTSNDPFHKNRQSCPKHLKYFILLPSSQQLYDVYNIPLCKDGNQDWETRLNHTVAKSSTRDWTLFYGLKAYKHSLLLTELWYDKEASFSEPDIFQICNF